MTTSKQTIFIRILKIVGWILLGIFALVVAVLLLLQTNWAQQKIRKEAVSYLEKKLRTRVQIGNIRINWLYNLELDEVYIEDQGKKPLVYVGKLEASYRLLDLLDNQLTIRRVSVDSLYAHIFRAAGQEKFNYSFIADAFSDSSSVSNADTLSDGTGLKWNLGKLELHRINLIFDDQEGGQEYRASVTSLETNISRFDLDKQLYGLEYLETLNLRAKVHFTRASAGDSTETTETPPGPSPVISLGTATLAQTDFEFEDQIGGIKTYTNAGRLEIHRAEVDLNEFTAAVKSVSLEDHNSTIVMGKTQNMEQKPSSGQPDNAPAFRFAVDEISILRNSVAYDDASSPRQARGMDFGHLNFSGLNAGMENLVYDGNAYKVRVDSLRITEASGFSVKQFKGEITYSDKGVKWEDGILATNRNYLAAGFEMAYDSLGQIRTHPNRVVLEADIRQAQIVLDDLLYILPELWENEYVRALMGKTFEMKTSVKGRLNDFTIPALTVRQGTVNLHASAKVSGLPDMDKLKIDLRLTEFSGTREGLLGWLPENLLPEGFRLPERFALSGTYTGGLNDLQTNLSLRTSEGNVVIQGNASNLSDERRARYNVRAATEGVDVGAFIGNETIGKANIHIDLSGTGYDPRYADATFAGAIHSLEANGYTYSKIDFNGKLQDQLLKAELQSADTNLRTHLTLNYSLDSTRPSMVTAVNAEYIDLKALGFSADPLTVKGRIDADFPSLDPDRPVGKLVVHQIQVGKEGEIFALDSILVTAARDLDTQRISIRSPFLGATLKGKYELTKLIADASLMVARYRSERPDTIPLPSQGQQAELRGIVFYPRIAKSLVPAWTHMTPARINGDINSATGEMSLVTNVQQLQYGDFNVDSLNLSIEGDIDSLDYYVGIKRLMHPTFPLFQTRVRGMMSHSKITWTVETDDAREKPRYRLNGLVLTQPGRTVLQFSPGILLNAETWDVNPDNEVVFQNGGLAGGNLKLLRNNQQMAVTTGANGVPVNLQFNAFPLTAIAGIIQTDTALAEGYLTGDVVVPQLNPFHFNADLRIDSLKGFGYPVGQLTAKADSRDEGVYNLDIGLGGFGNDVRINGWYNANDSGSMHFDASLNPISMQSLQPFLNTYLDSMQGTLSGKFTVNGPVSAPTIRGQLRTNKAGLIYRDYNTFVVLPNETIVFDEQGVLLNDVVVADRERNEAVVSGRVFTTDYTQYRFNLALKARNFLAISTQARPEQWIYGPAWIDADLTVKGDMDLPVIDGNVKLRDGSDFTVVIKEDDPGVEERKGIITFVDKDNPPDSALIAKQQAQDSATTAKISGLSMSVNVEVTPKSTFTLVLDEMNGDFLKVKGTASLNTTIDASGKTSMTGRYMVEEGEYQLSLNQLIKRNFKIANGGTIVWNGDPTSATLDLSAVYEVSTTAYTLIKDVVSNSNTAAVRQKFPFQVYLNIKGEMLQPDISFRLDMPERDRNIFDGAVYTRLKQINLDPSELNKQVMGLLVLNTFIADNPFASLENSFSGNLESTARRTAGKILGQQLNNLLGDMIKGVDLTFDVESKDDFSSGTQDTQTDLNIGVSKNLFNDRTTVTIGSKVGLEGANNTSSLAGDITIEYKLTRDGRYRIKLYRINNDEAILEGQVIETGVSFVLFMDFNRFRELFQRVREEKIIKRRDGKEKTENNDE